MDRSLNYAAPLRGWKPILVALLFFPGACYSQSGPQPPCGMEPSPPYPGLDDSAVVKLWSRSGLGGDWQPPACSGWTAPGFAILITIDARFRHFTGIEGLLHRIGAISKRTGILYWSTTHKQWQTLVEDAYALTGPQFNQRRQDFLPDEMKAGKVLYFAQADNLSGKAVFRLHISEASENRLVFDMENVTTMRYFFVPVLRPGEMQSVYFLNRETEDLWDYYSIVRIGKNANRLTSGSESSTVNRAVAFYRDLVGIPTNQEPPAAR